MSSLEELLLDTTLFDVVSSSVSEDGNTHVCIGRALEKRLWANYVTSMLRAEHKAIQSEQLPSNVLSISKFFYIGPSGAVMFMWKIVCLNTDWFAASVPPVEKATWNKGFSTELDADGFPKKVSLVSTTGQAKIPQPKDLGLSDSSGGVTLSD